MRTDVYYLLTTAARCPRLHAIACTLLTKRLNNLLGRHGRSVDESALTPRDRRLARFYAPLIVTGYATAFVVLLAVIAPLAWEVLAGAAQGVFTHSPSPARFWDSVAVLAVNAAQIGLATILAIRERSRR